MRAALDYYGVPYTYFADQKLQGRQPARQVRRDHLPARGRHRRQSMIAGIAMTGNAPIPYKKTAQTPNLGGIDETDDIRGGMGFEGLQELAKFVQAGRGADHRRFHHHADGGVQPGRRRDRGAPGRNCSRAARILRGVFSDLKSPIAYGYDGKDSAGLLQSGSGAQCVRRRLRRLWRRRRSRRRDQWRRGPERDPERRADSHLAARSQRRSVGGSAGGRRAVDAAAAARVRREGRRRWRRGRGGQFAAAGPRRAWCCASPLTPTTCCSPARWAAARPSPIAPLVVDMPMGSGHVVLFALRPVLALADAGHLLPRFQRHPELGSPRCRQGGAGRRGPPAGGQ